MAEWISVNDRLPDSNEDVLVCVIDSGEPCVMYGVRLNDGEWEWEGDAIGGWWEPLDLQVTHWMPLPEPPKEVQDGN